MFRILTCIFALFILLSLSGCKGGGSGGAGGGTGAGITLPKGIESRSFQEARRQASRAGPGKFIPHDFKYIPKGTEGMGTLNRRRKSDYYFDEGDEV